jgi:NitT/TauT family transport system ATP-binding protein
MLSVEHLSKTYGEGPRAVQAIGDLSFEVAEKEFVCIVGPSGCGKTTLLKCISGLLAPTGGDVRLKDVPVTGPPPNMALVFQEYSRSLFPWLTVRQNVALPLRRKVDKGHARRMVEEAVDAVGLTRFLDSYPWQLSGGMQQRVAIARALAYQPEVLLMDEPFAAVDAQTRITLGEELNAIAQATRKTILFVTHNVDEAVFLGDRCCVLSGRPGRVKALVPVRIPRARRGWKLLMSDPTFDAAKEKVFGLVREEVGKEV